MSNTPIELKGSSFTLSVVHLHNVQPEVIRQALEDKIAQAPAFLKNAPVVVNIAALEAPFNWPEILKAVQATGLRIMGVSGCKDATLKAQIGRSGIPLLTEGKEKVLRTEPVRPEPVAEEKVIAPAPAPVAAAQTRIIDTPVRSGQRIYAPGSDLIVTSHVSAGAELIADGNIHIYGMMRGRALAGASGNRDAQIFCTHLGAELVSIAGVYWLSEQIPADFSGKAARMCLTDGVLSVQPLD
ncbi:septum site-determining protein MinC [Shimwellia blattae]|uniref:Probable septum site-determining protein MinC n=1 Tax=Shimwellia blattae (strain ATCC 29907 / DSM 4481 / JCM 1650 / NBRC 105725 / CDC 9005-74) TaxID=630626 RepID=I2B8M0_SHIBC|nr:septum site-determining protein MinC [Shimwellia blattae]AFJ46874.1 septum site-determining protein MinC [Shimwellia blattae DSM 4481 = NBRC 105725]GAB82466.1 putative septum site-determining protein MinC [Shimwellia blattae DSM 4481 = NBRC 105725]VDY64358.1 Septum site-determining protein MinC [Shimwellia blattae]VEC22476.1 Septum site-determining protein MinC [Shimwellia blattae]